MLLFVACDKTCGIKPPKDVKPIDWENYNDVSTVYWNTYSYKEIENFPLDKEIMVCGWVYHPKYSNINPARFELIDNFSDVYNSAPSVIRVNVLIFSSEIQAVFDTYDSTKKCFVKGKLNYNKLFMGRCTRLDPEIYVSDTNDIYFK
ncbi:MAG: hypothetical protein WC142_04295 [Bacteroidales bacterium]